MPILLGDTVIQLTEAGVAAVLVFAMVLAGTRIIGIVGRGSSLAGRLNKYSEVKAKPIEEKRIRPKRSLLNRGSRTKAADAFIGTLDRIVENQSFAEKIRNALSRADLRMTVGEYMILWGVSIVLGLFVGQVLFKTFIHTVVFTGAGILGPWWYLKYRAGRRLKKFNASLADTIVMMANSLRSGYSLLQSMELVSREMPPPISIEFNRVIKEVGIGLAPEEALANLVRRIRSVDVEIMVMAINVQREIGGNLSVILDTIAHTIRERIRIKGEIKTLTAQASLSGYVICILPLGLAFILYTLEPKQMSFFWTNTTCGLPMLIATIIFMTMGFFIMRKITQIEV